MRVFESKGADEHVFTESARVRYVGLQVSSEKAVFIVASRTSYSVS
jgi:hypothetical protein